MRGTQLFRRVCFALAWVLAPLGAGCSWARRRPGEPGRRRDGGKLCTGGLDGGQIREFARARAAANRGIRSSVESSDAIGSDPIIKHDDAAGAVMTVPM